MHYHLRIQSRSAAVFCTALVVCSLAAPGYGATAYVQNVFWTKVPGASLREIAVAGTNDGGIAVWGIGTSPADSQGNYTILHMAGSHWETIPGQALKIAVESTGVPWVITAQGNIFRQNTAVAGGWEKMPGAATDIAIGPGEVFVLGGTQRGVNNGLYSWNGEKWLPRVGMGVRAAVDPWNMVWLVNQAGVAWQQDVTVSGGWRQILGGAISDISVGGNGNPIQVWSIGAVRDTNGNSPVQQWYGAGWAQAIDHLGGVASGVKVAVGPDGNLWVVTAAGAVLYGAVKTQ